MRHYGLAEIAEALGVSKVRVAQWRREGYLPAPDSELAMGPVWTAPRIERWMEEWRAERPYHRRRRTAPRPRLTGGK